MAPKPAAPTDARSALRARLAAGGIPQQREDVIIDLPDGPLALEARGITAGDRWQIQSQGFAEKQGADGETTNQVVPREFWPMLICATYYVPGTNERMWQPTVRDAHGNIVTKGDEDEIAAMSSEIVDALGAPALKLAGMGVTSRAELRGNSDAEPAPAGSASA